MIKHPSAPSRFEALAPRRNAAAWLTRHNQGTHGRAGQIHPFFLSHFGQAEGVRGRAEDHRGRMLKQKPQTSGAAHATTRQAQIALSAGRIKRGPETEERSEGK